MALSLSPEGMAGARILKRLTVSQVATSDGMKISFSVDGKGFPSDAIQLSQEEPKLIKFSMDGVRCNKSWLKWSAPDLHRVLIFPSKSQKGRCYLKVRMRKAIPKNAFEGIRSTRDEKTLTYTFSWNPQAVQIRDEQPSEDEVQLVKTEVEGQPSSQVSDEEAETQPQLDERASPKASEVVLPEAPLGPSLEVSGPEDELLSRERPHSMIETVVIGQIERARAFQPAPVILSLPIEKEMGEEINSEEEQLMERSGALLTKLIDREAVSRGGSIWIADPDLRIQISRLNVNVPRLSLSQERLLASHVGAGLISRSSLRFSREGDGEGDLILSTMMSPSEADGSISESDPGVYRVEHRISRALLEAALDDAWVTEYRSSALWRAALLPGWGHLYRGERRRGWLFMSAGLSLAGGAILSGVLGAMAASDYRENDPNTSHRRSDANAHYDRANLLWTGAAVVYLTSLVDTFVNAEDRSYLDVSRLDWERARQRAERGGE